LIGLPKISEQLFRINAFFKKIDLCIDTSAKDAVGLNPDACGHHISPLEPERLANQGFITRVSIIIKAAAGVRLQMSPGLRDICHGLSGLATKKPKSFRELFDLQDHANLYCKQCVAMPQEGCPRRYCPGDHVGTRSRSEQRLPASSGVYSE
jgi:hypothetical protein